MFSLLIESFFMGGNSLPGAHPAQVRPSSAARSSMPLVPSSCCIIRGCYEMKDTMGLRQPMRLRRPGTMGLRLELSVPGPSRGTEMSDNSGWGISNPLWPTGPNEDGGT